MVVTDDGVATGATLRAAIAHVTLHPSYLVCALPVGPPDTIAAITAESTRWCASASAGLALGGVLRRLCPGERRRSAGVAGVTTRLLSSSSSWLMPDA